jgi:hypothetical protein
MKKLFLALVSFSFLSAGAQTVDEVIQKYAANLGGLDAFNKIKTAKITATFSSQGMDLPMTIQIIIGKAARTDVEAMGSAVIRVYNNGKGWTQNPFAGITTPKEVTGAELIDFKSQTQLASALMDYKARGHQVELQGQVDVEGKKAFKIKLTAKDDGRVTYYYINSTDYLMLKSETDREMQGQTVTVEMLYSDLKEFNGAKFFMTKTQKIEGQVFQTTTFTNIELNVPVDEKIFDMPK